jgi:putative phosphoribosyl transferase
VGVCVAPPRTSRGVGQFYERFDQVTDEEAMTYLER